jgi:hypothetical protein
LESDNKSKRIVVTGWRKTASLMRRPKAIPKHYKRLVLRQHPGLKAPRNIESWSVIMAILNAYGGAYYDDLVAAVSQHRDSGGGKGFVDYCISNGWLIEYRWLVKSKNPEEK